MHPLVKCILISCGFLALGWGYAWFVDDVLKLPLWGGMALYVVLCGIVIYLIQQAEQKKQAAIVEHIAAQDQALKEAQEKLAQRRD